MSKYLSRRFVCGHGTCDETADHIVENIRKGECIAKYFVCEKHAKQLMEAKS